MDCDAEIVRVLQDDGRASVQQISRLIGQPRSAVSARIDHLLKDGSVRVVAAVAPAVLGQRVLAHVSIRTEGPSASVAEFLSAQRETVLVSAVGGYYDFVTEVRCSSMDALRAFLGQVRSIEHVAELNVLQYLSIVRGFFVSQYVGGASIDSIDVALIGLLQQDGRRSYRSLADRVQLSPSAVAARVNRLLRSGVIKISAVEVRGTARRQLSMGVGVILRGPEHAALLHLIQELAGIEFAAVTVGRFDIVLTLVASSTAALLENLERIRSVPGVVRTECWQHLSVLKEDYTRTLRIPRPATGGGGRRH